ncbi:hypothetical protein ABT337_25900 [Saccharopolyspora hirsuta]|uniref:Uncharacterized protein n=1 Tax=Saccharopolyspora hirsuta TaxID=1837 RepID=A0A5M7BPP2_SACHI|nr:hypothetical protein [Saccharopolyspora hirsuta]KAA5829244.1 hypothetical protein F1721_26660 [Saccharopolyspora hirsuta]MBF6508078.1 hypothetical protein [Nocardia farcinica]
MTGSCAQRAPRSRLALLVARVSLFSAFCFGGWLGGSAVAEAVELPDVEPPEIEVAAAEPDIARPLLDDLRPELDEVQRSEPQLPDAVEIDPPAPVDEQEPPAATDEPAPAPVAAPTVPPPAQQRAAAPPRVEQAAPLPPEPVSVPRDHPRSAAEPRAPNTTESADETPRDGGDHDTDVPQQPASGSGSGVNDLRGALVVLPTGPSLTDPSAVGSTRAENRPVTGLSSAEPSASPD